MRRARGRLPAIFIHIVLTAAAASADGPIISGVVDASASAAAGAGGAPDFSIGFEEFANLRLRASVGERGVIHAAVNLIAAAGADAAHLDPQAGGNYAAALELERLYFRIRGDELDIEAGLMRVPFGYGQAFRPSDFLNPPNPLLPDARPRGVLGATASFYPVDEIKLLGFVAAGRDPLEYDGSGMLFGLAADAHGDWASMQTLYAYQAPDSVAKSGLHYAGVSVKLEAEVGIVLDSLFVFDPLAGTGFPDAFRGAIGVDYSFFDGTLYSILQYLYNGPGALAPGEDLGRLYAEADWYATAPAARTPAAGLVLGEFNRRNYLYMALLYNFDDYTRGTLSCLAGLDDLSFSPAVTIEHEPFQGLTLSLTCRVPLDGRTFSEDWSHGELGPANTGQRIEVSIKARLRF